MKGWNSLDGLCSRSGTGIFFFHHIYPSLYCIFLLVYFRLHCSLWKPEFLSQHAAPTAIPFSEISAIFFSNFFCEESSADFPTTLSLTLCLMSSCLLCVRLSQSCESVSVLILRPSCCCLTEPPGRVRGGLFVASFASLARTCLRSAGRAAGRADVPFDVPSCFRCDSGTVAASRQ